MTDLFSYSTERAWKKPGTSSDAAEAASRKAPYWRGKCLDALRVRSMTGDEVAAFLGVDVLTIRPRLTECFNQGLIETTGERRPTPRGRTADVWRVRE